jgi:hypothetical protein
LADKEEKKTSEVKEDKKDKKEKKKKEPRQKDIMKAEARKILLNQMEIGKDGHFVSVDEFRLQTWGSADGEHKVRFLGVHKKRYLFISDYDNKKAVYRVAAAMENVGRMVDLHCNPDAAACLVKTYIFYPAVLVFYETDSGDLTLNVYTARTLTAPLAVRASVAKFGREVSDFLLVINRKGEAKRVGVPLKEKLTDFLEKREKR